MYSQKTKIKSPEKALETLEWLCSKMERCTLDAKRSLYRWGVTSEEEQQKIIDKLIKNGFISNRRYAAAYVRDKLITGRWGAAKIRAGLRAKAIESEIIEEAIAENIEPQRLTDKLEQNIRRHYIKEKDKAESMYALRGKLFRRAASQGFDIEEINRIIEKVINE